MTDMVERTGAKATGCAPSAPASSLIEITDIAVALGLPLLAAVSWFLPQRAWRGFCRACVPFYGPGQAGQPSTPAVQRQIRQVLGARTPARPFAAVAGDLIEEDILSLVELLHVYRPGGWRPAIELVGGEHLAAAQAAGRGTIVWLGHFVHANLVAKMALHRAGFAVSHLSHRRHGFSGSRFGVRWLNRVQTAAEDRYLGERVLLDDERPATTMRTLRRRLEENRVVSISVRGDGGNSRAIQFFDGEVSIAAGAPKLAALSGAALLPVFPVRNAAGGFTVFVEPALDVRGDGALRRYAALLEKYVLTYPAQWLGWFHLSTTMTASRAAATAPGLRRAARPAGPAR